MHYDPEKTNQLIKKFESMIKDNNVLFFDVEEFEQITDYYFQKGSNNKALAAIDLATDQHPLSAIFPIKRAQYLTAYDKMDEAMKELDRAEALEPNSYEMLVARSHIYAKKNKHGKSVSLLLEALAVAEEPADVHAMLAEQYQYMGKYEEALKHHKQVLKVFIDDEIALYNVALCYEMLNQNEKSVVFFNQYIDKNPYSEIAWYNLGIAYSRINKLKEACNAFDYATIVDEHFIAAYYEKGRVLERSGDYYAAACTYEASFEFDAPSGYSYYRLGNCYRNLKQHNEALKYFRRAIKEDPDLDEAHVELSMMYLDNGKILEAIHHIKTAIKIENTNPDYYLIAADVYKRAGLYLESEECFKKIFTLDYDEPEVFVEYADLLLDMDETDMALELMHKGILKHPNSGMLQAVLAGFVFEVGAREEGFNILEQSLQYHENIEEIFFEAFPDYKEDEEIVAFFASKK